MVKARKTTSWVVGLIALGVGACTDASTPARSAENYSSVEELAKDLGVVGLCDDFKPLSSVDFEFGECRPDGTVSGDTPGMLVAVLADSEVLRQHRRWDETGCNGSMVYGPNWNVGPLKPGEIGDILDALGGRVVGETETVDC